jgi:hypothetical protein
LAAPDLPAFEPVYAGVGTPDSIVGVLRFQKELRALWVNKAGDPIGWEVVKSYPAALKPHTVELVQRGKPGWEGFEAALRTLVMEDDMDIGI